MDGYRIHKTFGIHQEVRRVSKNMLFTVNNFLIPLTKRYKRLRVVVHPLKEIDLNAMLHQLEACLNITSHRNF